MVRGKCQNFCRQHYGNIISESIATVKRKFSWIKCGICNVFWKFTLIKSYFCPCCHGVCQKRKRIHNDITKRKKALEKKTRLHNYYMGHKFKFKMYDRIRKLQRKKIKEEQIPNLISIISNSLTGSDEAHKPSMLYDHHRQADYISLQNISALSV